MTAFITFKGPLVGARFRPGAETALQLLPVGTALLIRRQPDNPYDANAVAVYIEGLNGLKDIAPNVLDEFKQQDGNEEETELPDPFHLCYVAREQAAMMAETIDKAVEDGRSVSGTLVFTLEGRPQVEIKIQAKKD